MSVVFLATLSVVLLFVGLVCLTFYGRRIRRINAMFRDLAERYEGHLAPAGLLRHPCMQFTYQGQRVLVYTEQANTGKELVHTVFRSSCPDSTLSLQVTPARFYTGVARLFGGRTDVDDASLCGHALHDG